MMSSLQILESIIFKIRLNAYFLRKETFKKVCMEKILLQQPMKLLQMH